MVGAAVGLTGGIGASGNALVVGLRADEVRKGLGVLRGVGGDAVAADAVVAEVFLEDKRRLMIKDWMCGTVLLYCLLSGGPYSRAVVGQGHTGGGLEADQGAGGLLLVTPVS